ncbi:putative rossmann-like alpha/beta/alpha sandwich protein [Helianthus annuus]|nr:putative rossmann-like alpha/beta/alpha sandwich protein [Helianthus annuus]
MHLKILIVLKRSHDVLVEVVEGDARNVLCEAVERHHATMLVVGSIGEAWGSIFPNSGGAKTYIPKNFYTKVLFITLRVEKFGGRAPPPAPRKLRPWLVAMVMEQSKVLGSVSDYVTHHAHCTVMIVKKPPNTLVSFNPNKRR